MAAHLRVGLERQDQAQQPAHVRPGPGGARPAGDRQVGPVGPGAEPHAREQPVRGRARRHADQVAQQRRAGRGVAPPAPPLPVEGGGERRAGDQHREAGDTVRGRRAVAGPVDPTAAGELEVPLDREQGGAHHEGVQRLIEPSRPTRARRHRYPSRNSRSQPESTVAVAPSRASATPGAPLSSPGWSTRTPSGSTSR